LADIGGTNARFGWIARDSDEVQHVATLPVAEHAGPTAAAKTYLARLEQTLGADWLPPAGGAFAVATAVGGDRIAFTNSGWSFSRAEVERELDLRPLLVLNDFEALALSLPRLKAEQLRGWPNAPVGLPNAALAVIGPGTGLGVAGLVSTPHGFVAVPGEGGHATLAAADEFESDLLAAARRLHPHVSASACCLGSGCPCCTTRWQRRSAVRARRPEPSP
jgi:glucokinase